MQQLCRHSCAPRTGRSGRISSATLKATALRTRRVHRSRIIAQASGDRVIRSLSADAEVTVLVCDSKQLVQEAVNRHKTAPTASAALGRALVGAVLLGVYRREDEAIQITWRGDGPLGGLMVISDATGQVRGRVGNAECNLPLKANGKFDVGGAVGAGELQVVRSHPLEPVPYTGTVPIFNGEIAEDLAHYMLDSEQMNCALALGVLINSADGSIRAAGGYFIQVLPFASDETLEKLEQNLTKLPSISELLDQGKSLETITEMILEDIGTAPDPPMIVEPKFGPCGEDVLRPRMLRALAALGKADVEEMLDTDGQIEVRCDFCNETLVFTRDNQAEINQIADGLGKIEKVY